MIVDEATWLVVDCETTGLDPATDHVVEIAAVATCLREPNLGMWATLVKPPIAIPPEMSAIHGITDSDVVGAPDITHAVQELGDFVARFREPVLVAHNSEFDMSFLGLNDGRMPILCTKRLAMHLWPNLPQHRNQSLRYRLELKVDTFGIAPHRALGDALVTAAILRTELEIAMAKRYTDVDALIAYAEAPILLPTFPFGKHEGAPIADIPESYLRWCLREMKDLSRDLRFTIEQTLETSKGAA